MNLKVDEKIEDDVYKNKKRCRALYQTSLGANELLPKESFTFEKRLIFIFKAISESVVDKLQLKQ